MLWSALTCSASLVLLSQGSAPRYSSLDWQQMRLSRFEFWRSSILLYPQLRCSTCNRRTLCCFNTHQDLFTRRECTSSKNTDQRYEEVFLYWVQEDHIGELVKHLLSKVFEVKNILSLTNSERTSFWTQKFRRLQWKVSSSMEIEIPFCISCQKTQTTLTRLILHFGRMRKNLSKDEVQAYIRSRNM